MEAKPRNLAILDILTIGLVLIAAGLVFFYAPMEKIQGNVQKVFYFHVAVGWVGMLSFIASAGVGIAYLRSGDRKWDLVSLAAIEIGIVFLLMNIITGSIWARPIWNTWWTWEPRLVTVTIMELLYLAYMMLRQGIEDPTRRARFGAVYAIIASVSVPITYFSIRIYRSIHPVVFGPDNPTAEGTPGMTSPMRMVFFFCLITFSFVFFDLLWHRIRLGRLADKVEETRLESLT